MILFSLYSGCAGSAAVNYGSAPLWVIDVYSVYNRERYLAANGAAGDRVSAERNAIASLTALFGQSVQADFEAAVYYSQAVTDGVIDSYIDSAEIRQNIRTSSSMNNLVGVEISETWYDGKQYYAAAVMEKARAVRVYRDLIQVNLDIIENLTSENERGQLESVIRYRFAAAAADVNMSYRNIISVLGSSVSGLNTGDYYRAIAQDIIKTIPVAITVTGDRNSKLSGAFAKCFSDWGFNVITEYQQGPRAADNTRYVLNAGAVFTPVSLPDNPNFFSRVEITANFTDTFLNAVLIPYSISAREGHPSMPEAEARAVASVEQGIKEGYSEILSDYLSRLLPKK